MYQLGEYLRSLREDKNLSLKDVQKATNITDSKLSRIENGGVEEPSPIALKKLAYFYNVDVIELFILAEFLDKDDLSAYKRVFHYADLLNNEEKNLIQQNINIFTKQRTERN